MITNLALIVAHALAAGLVVTLGTIAGRLNRRRIRRALTALTARGTR